MTAHTRLQIKSILAHCENPDELVDKIATVSDAEIVQVVGRIQNFGELLDAVGLEIRPKEGKS